MKKILMSALIILLLVLIGFAIFKGIKFAKIKSIEDIKYASYNLDDDVEKAKTLAIQTYPNAKQALETAITELQSKKEEFENKNSYNAEQINIGAIEVKTYKIHYLWTILGNYRKDEGVRSINLDLKTTSNKDVYDLQFTLVGNYISITDFLYDIEDDEELRFQIKDLQITRTDDKIAKTTATTTTNENTNTIANSPVTTNTTNTTSKKSTSTTTVDNSEGGTILKATFTVENIGITLD